MGGYTQRSYLGDYRWSHTVTHGVENMCVLLAGKLDFSMKGVHGRVVR
jgi:hypothetical protein